MDGGWGMVEEGCCGLGWLVGSWVCEWGLWLGCENVSKQWYISADSLLKSLL